MSVPSFLYSPLDAETQRMADELAYLGGGDARAINMEVHCILDDRLSRLDNQTVWLSGESVNLRDTTLPMGTPIAECMRSHPFSSSCKLQDVLQFPPESFPPVR